MTSVAASAELIAELRAALGAEAVITEPEALLTYDSDSSMLVAHPPAIVVVPPLPNRWLLRYDWLPALVWQSWRVAPVPVLLVGLYHSAEAW